MIFNFAHAHNCHPTPHPLCALQFLIQFAPKMNLQNGYNWMLLVVVVWRASSIATGLNRMENTKFTFRRLNMIHAHATHACSLLFFSGACVCDCRPHNLLQRIRFLDGAAYIRTRGIATRTVVRVSVHGGCALAHRSLPRDFFYLFFSKIEFGAVFSFNFSHGDGGDMLHILCRCHRICCWLRVNDAWPNVINAPSVSTFMQVIILRGIRVFR